MNMNASNRNLVSQLSIIGGFIVLGYGLWKSRYKIQEMLESVGVDTPWMKDSVGETFRSGAAKLKGSAKRDLDHSATL